MVQTKSLHHTDQCCTNNVSAYQLSGYQLKIALSVSIMKAGAHMILLHKRSCIVTWYIYVSKNGEEAVSNLAVLHY